MLDDDQPVESLPCRYSILGLLNTALIGWEPLPVMHTHRHLAQN